MMKNRSSTVIAVVIAVLLLPGCATTSNIKQIDRLGAVSENPRILIMKPDVKYYLLTAGATSR